MDGRLPRRGRGRAAGLGGQTKPREGICRYRGQSAVPWDCAHGEQHCLPGGCMHRWGRPCRA